MRPSPLRLALALAAVAILATGAAQSQDDLSARPPDPVRDLMLADARPGLTGYVLTEGPDGVARFEVELLAIQEADALGVPLLLIRGSGPFLDASGGVAAGMSGSPVYLGADGRERLAGALAYAFPNGDHRLALVTPIEAMRALANDDGSAADIAHAPPTSATPIATPVLLHGLDARAAAHLTPAFDRAGLRALPVQGGASVGAADPGPHDLAPGSALAALLAWGDVRVAAVGTVTARDGDDLLAFGHPLLRTDPAGYALTDARITAIVPSREMPFKLANVRADTLGRVARDGRAGLAGLVGADATGLPVTIRVESPRAVHTLRVRLAAASDLAPALLAAVVQRAVDEARDAVGGGSADLAWTFSFPGEPELRMLDQQVDRYDLATETARLAASPLAVLHDNPFRAPNLARLSLRIEIHDGMPHADLVEIALETPEVDSGGTVLAFVRMQPFREEAEVRTLRIPVPDDAEPGPLRLTFRGASVPDPEAQERDPPPPDPLRQPTSGLPPVLSWAELMVALHERPQARELLVEIPGELRPRRLARFDAGAPVQGLERVTVTVRDPADRSGDGGSDDGSDDGDGALPPDGSP